MQNNRAQMGETITWVIATIIIVVLLMFFIFGASMLGTTKSVGGFKESLFSSPEYSSEDLFIQKSIYSYLAASTDVLKKKIELDLEERNEAIFQEKLTRIRRIYNKK